MTAKYHTLATEAQEQEALFEWVHLMASKYPGIDLLYHVPNEGKRSYQQGRMLKQEGLKPGFPDLCLPVARGRYHGLYIELKRLHGTTPTDLQEQWLRKLSAQGYAACWCQGWQSAARVLSVYMQTGQVVYEPTKGRAGDLHA